MQDTPHKLLPAAEDGATSSNSIIVRVPASLLLHGLKLRLYMQLSVVPADTSCLTLAIIVVVTHVLCCIEVAPLLTLVLLVHAGYMVDKLGVPEAEVHDLSRELYHGYGTTMCGLLTHGYQLDVDDWHAAVHDSLEYDKLLHEQPTTRQVRGRAGNIPT
jgi:hypothetical protein